MIRRPRLVESLLPLLLLLDGAASPAPDAQNELNAVLHSVPRSRISQYRAACATGKAGSWQQMLKDAGFKTASPGAWCVTVLTRAGRDGVLAYVRVPGSISLSSSLAFDSGFVGGFQNAGALPADAPSMLSLLPVADRCLQQSETNPKLCTAAGFMLGVRASHGEVVALG